MKMFAQAREFLADCLEKVAGVDITYTRGAYSCQPSGWIGQSAVASNTDGGARIEFTERDYVIRVETLRLNGQLVEPARGDRITEVILGVTLTFEVRSPSSTNEPAWRYSDAAGRTLYRLHCKRVG